MTSRFLIGRRGAAALGLAMFVASPVRAQQKTPRIVSVGSALTEIFYALGAENLLVGVDTTSLYPPQAKSLPQVGYMRALSNRGRVIVRGEYAPVVGRVSMDLTLVEVTDVEGAAEGDVMTLLGADGALGVPAEDLAQTAGTISYEVTCGVSRRVPRLHVPIDKRGI